MKANHKGWLHYARMLPSNGFTRFHQRKDQTNGVGEIKMEQSPHASQGASNPVQSLPTHAPEGLRRGCSAHLNRAEIFTIFLHTCREPGHLCHEAH